MEEKTQVRMMGTVIDLWLIHGQRRAILPETLTQLKIYEQRFSANDPASELMQVNSQAGIKPVRCHPQLFELIKTGKAASLEPNSLLNIAIGPLVQTWRIGFADAKVPSEAEIKQQLSLTDPNKIILDSVNETVFLTDAGMKIDLGALAKGYIADLLVADLKAAGVTAGLLNLGGNVVTFGPSLHQDGLWRIGIRNPKAGPDDFLRLVKIRDGSVVTSGIYERALKKDGQTYYHIFNPQTGYPIETQLASLTIVSRESLTGEIWTTQLFGLTPEKIMASLNQQAQISGVVITQDDQLFQSNNFTEHIEF